MFNVPRIYVEKLCEDCKVKGEHFIDVECYLASTHQISYRVFCSECWNTAINLKTNLCTYRFHIIPVQDWTRVVSNYINITPLLN